MSFGAFFKGTTEAQDGRWSNKQRKLMAKMSFPKHFDTVVDMKNVNMEIVRAWIGNRVRELLGFEDEVVSGLAINLLEDTKKPDPRHMQVTLTGFMEHNTRVFMSELWAMLISASTAPGGIPTQLLDAEGDRIESQRKAREEKSERIAARMGFSLGASSSSSPPSAPPKPSSSKPESIITPPKYKKPTRSTRSHSRSRSRSLSGSRSHSHSRSRSRSKRRDKSRERDRRRGRRDREERRPRDRQSRRERRRSPQHSRSRSNSRNRSRRSNRDRRR